MSTLIVSLFVAATAAAYAAQTLDWYNTKQDIAKTGLAGETNPIIRFFYGKSQWLALLWKTWPQTLILAAALHFHDIVDYGVKYVNASGVDKWAIGWILAQVAIAGIGLYGYLSSKKA